MPAAFPFVALLFAAFGVAWGAWVVLLADLKAALGLSAGALGVALTATMVAALPAALWGGRIADRWGTRLVVAAASGGMAAAFAAAVLVEGLPALVGILLLLAGSGGVYDLGINAAGVHLERHSRRRLLSYLHAAFSGAGALGALMAGGLLHAGLAFRWIYLIVAAFMAAVGLAALWSRHLAHRSGGGHSAPVGAALIRNRSVLLLGLITALGLLSEGTLESWAAIYLRGFLDLPAVLGATGVAVFHGAMMTGRLLAAPVVAAFDRRRVLQVAGAVTAAGMTIALATVSPPVILGGFLLVGLGLAVIVPVAFSLAGELDPERVGEAVAVVAVISYSGFIAGPALIGGLAQWLGLRLALTAVIACGLLVVVLGRRVQSGDRP